MNLPGCFRNYSKHEHPYQYTTFLSNFNSDWISRISNAQKSIGNLRWWMVWDPCEGRNPRHQSDLLNLSPTFRCTTFCTTDASTWDVRSPGPIWPSSKNAEYRPVPFLTYWWVSASAPALPDRAMISWICLLFSFRALWLLVD